MSSFVKERRSERRSESERTVRGMVVAHESILFTHIPRSKIAEAVHKRDTKGGIAL